MKVTPWVTGGEIVRTEPRNGFSYFVHKPVFENFIGQANEGFVQIGWKPLASLPAIISENVSLDGNGVVDFHLDVDTQKMSAHIAASSPLFLGTPEIIRLSDSLLARIRMRNPERQ